MHPVKSVTTPSQKMGVPGHSGGYDRHGSLPTRAETAEDLCRGQIYGALDDSVGESSGQTHWKDECSKSCGASGAIVLQTPTNAGLEHGEQQPTRLRRRQ